MSRGLTRGAVAGVSIRGGAGYAVHTRARAALEDCGSLFGKPSRPV